MILDNGFYFLMIVGGALMLFCVACLGIAPFLLSSELSAAERDSRENYDGLDV